MINPEKYFAIQVTTDELEKYLCWKKGKHLYFAAKGKGFSKPYPPTLFRTKKEAKEAFDNCPEKGGNTKMFQKLIEARYVKFIPVYVSLK